MSDWYSSLFMSEEERARRREMRDYVRGGRNVRVTENSVHMAQRRGPQMPQVSENVTETNAAIARQRRDAADIEQYGAPVVRLSDPAVSDAGERMPFGDNFASWVLYLDAMERPQDFLTGAPEEALPQWDDVRPRPAPTLDQLERPLEPETAPPEMRPDRYDESPEQMARRFLEARRTSRQRQETGQPSVADYIMRAIFGTRGGDPIERLRRENQELQMMIARGEWTPQQARDLAEQQRASRVSPSRRSR